VDLSFIVSAYDRPEHLICCLASLNIQTHKDIEVIVTDNSNDPTTQEFHREYCEQLGARYIHTGLPGCYHSAEEGAKHATGTWLGFPSDDSYFVPHYAEFMLKAARDQNLDLVYAEQLYSPRWESEPYHLMGVKAQLNFIDKTGFLLKRSLFTGFPDKIANAPCAADGLLIDRLVASGIRHGYAPGILSVHNA
jgi:glycosyltransferase involved in cell wall biosynthesis